MPVSRRRKAAVTAAVCAAIALAGMLCLCAGVRGQGVGRQASARLERPDASKIHSEVQSILSDPRYAPRKSFWQWLFEKLSKWEGPDFRLPAGAGAFLLWVVTVWCVLTLIAILAHLVWTIVVAVRGGAGGRRGHFWRRTPTGSVDELTYDELVAHMRTLAQKGLFRQAVSIMMLALLHWLDRVGFLRFHQSKTNGDYVREYVSAGPGRQSFRRFARDFDALIYGGAACEAGTYERMRSVFEEVQSDARQGT